MLTNSMRELTSSRSPGAGKLHFLPKLLVQEVARNCELELLLNRPLNFIFSHLSCHHSVSDSEVSLLLLTFTYPRLSSCLL